MGVRVRNWWRSRVVGLEPEIETDSESGSCQDTNDHDDCRTRARTFTGGAAARRSGPWRPRRLRRTEVSAIRGNRRSSSTVRRRRGLAPARGSRRRVRGHRKSPSRIRGAGVRRVPLPVRALGPIGTLLPIAHLTFQIRGLRSSPCAQFAAAEPGVSIQNRPGETLRNTGAFCESLATEGGRKPLHECTQMSCGYD